MVTTHQRDRLLLNRALPSILAQTFPASKIIVIEDQVKYAGEGGKPRPLAKQLDKAAPGATYLLNRRTRGLAGTLNTGLDHLARTHPDPASVFVALLDDDDAWMPDHLAAVNECLCQGAEVVATPFLRVESCREALAIHPPDSITTEMFQERSPGIQGSNLAVRLDILLEAGGFNEALPSCTDRDLMIRLSRRPNLRFARSEIPSVMHHADSDRPRLSQHGASAKLVGLEWFDHIHGPLMSQETRDRHLARAEQKFGWRPLAKDSCQSASMTSSAQLLACPPEDETPHLLIGIIVDDRRLESADRLLNDIAERVAAEGLALPDMLLLENRPREKSSSPFKKMLEKHREQLRIRVIDRDSLDHLIESGEWMPEGVNANGRLAIANARTVLQACLYHIAREKPGCAIWILDDDMRLNPLVATAKGPQTRPLALGQALRRMKATGADICIGSYTGAPPVPAVASVRGQMVDLMWNLRRLARLPAGARLPEAESHNAKLRTGRRDYFYDLSRCETDRLETPFALEPKYPGETCGEALTRLGQMIPQILAGEAPLRPILADPEAMETFKTGNMLFRGGNTFVFAPDALADLPNVSPTVKGRHTRRSDMIWSLLQARNCKRKVLSVPVPVRQDRSLLPRPEVLDHAGIADDICGFAIFSAMQDAGSNQDKIVKLCRTDKPERLAALNLTCPRVRGLARELMAWCQDEAPSYAPGKLLTEQAESLLNIFSADVFLLITSRVQDFGPNDVRKFIAGLDDHIGSYEKWGRNSCVLPQLMADERANAAKAAITAVVNPKAQLQVLGQGSEGVVVTDKSRVWKLFDGWTPERQANGLPILNQLVENAALGDALMRPLAMTQSPAGWLLALPYEPTEPWTGGHGPGLVELLADLHRAGLVCRNLHPKNLRQTAHAVRLVDYGDGLRPLDDPDATSLEFHRMCRRAWLCWRFWWHEDIKSLLTRSLTEPDMPELSGHEGLVQAVREQLGLGGMSDPTITRALALNPKRMLDYGAGNGNVASALAMQGAVVVAWDPDPGVNHRLDALQHTGVRRATSAHEAISLGPYTLVVCRRVACLLDDQALASVLSDLREAVAPNGRVLLTLCHPAYSHRVRVADSVPLSQPGKRICGTASWSKQVRPSKRTLHEFHRSERTLRRKLARAGLQVVKRHERFRIDQDRFETVADLLVLELAPAPTPDVTLLIKACAMDAEALETHVRDMLTALEGPTYFQEVILTLDNRMENFTRAHTKGDLDGLRKAARNLVAEGEIDRVVEASPHDLGKLNRRWFGLELAASHSLGGAATAALLTGFDACKSPFVLHADLDMMVGRCNRNLDPIAELTQVLKANPEAVTASFPVARTEPRPWTAEGSAGPWRVESRLGMVKMALMETMLPLPNDIADGIAPRLSWHRAMDEAVRTGQASSLRGDDGRAFCVHPQNSRKNDLLVWDEVRASIARGRSPAAQVDQVEWAGTIDNWRQPERHERFVFLINGRNLMPERFRRCWDSVLRQAGQGWGAIVIDDASVPWVAEEISQILAPFTERVSYIMKRRRVGMLANIVHAVRYLCASPGQVMVTLDPDDHLIGSQVLNRLANEYDQGADLTIGSMLRTDKPADYPVCLKNPRQHHGGNVWQHLRSFKKGLFDSLPDDILRLDGNYVDIANDWAYMLPLVEAAQKPVWIKEPLYMHEPGVPRTPARAAIRNRVISRLLAQCKFNKKQSR